MKNTFERIIRETELGKLILSYTYKNRRNGEAYIIYKDSDSHFQVSLEKNLDFLPKNTIGVIDNGQYMPI